MTDPIVTAQERELIERAGNFSIVDHGSPHPLIGELSDALQSRIAEVGRLTERARVLEEALRMLLRLERSIKIDVGLLHKNRLRQGTSSDLQIATDADLRTELEAAFDRARAALNSRSSEG